MTLVRPRTDQQLAVGAGVQVVLLAALSAGVGLGPVGWLAGVASTLSLWVLLTAAVRRAEADMLGPADLITLVRATFVGAVTALVTDRLWGGGIPVPTALVATATLALVLDAVDGQVARRTRTATALGARFDMEVDAFLILVLSVHVAVLVGPWTLAIGAMRYAFVAAGRLLPWMRSALPARFSGKAVAALQGIVLVVVTGEVLPHSLAVALVATALALLTWSFGRDMAWLWHNARSVGAENPDQAGIDRGCTLADRRCPAVGGGMRERSWVAEVGESNAALLANESRTSWLASEYRPHDLGDGRIVLSERALGASRELGEEEDGAITDDGEGLRIWVGDDAYELVLTDLT